MWLRQYVCMFYHNKINMHGVMVQPAIEGIFRYDEMIMIPQKKGSTSLKSQESLTTVGPGLEQEEKHITVKKGQRPQGPVCSQIHEYENKDFLSVQHLFFIFGLT